MLLGSFGRVLKGFYSVFTPAPTPGSTTGGGWCGGLHTPQVEGAPYKELLTRSQYKVSAEPSVGGSTREEASVPVLN